MTRKVGSDMTGFIQVEGFFSFDMVEVFSLSATDTMKCSAMTLGCGNIVWTVV